MKDKNTYNNNGADTNTQLRVRHDNSICRNVELIISLDEKTTTDETVNEITEKIELFAESIKNEYFKHPKDRINILLRTTMFRVVDPLEYLQRP